MASDQLAASLDFLTDAAHLMHSSAPEISAHLMRHRSNVLSQAGLPPPQLQRQHVCSACGHIMLPGQGTTVRLETYHMRKESAKQSSDRLSQGPSKVVTCGRCHRPTRTSFSAPEPGVRRRGGRPTPTAKTNPKTKTEATEPCEAPKKSANANSKRRAKDRKAGLQALLSRQQQASAGSLTLADFMGK